MMLSAPALISIVAASPVDRALLVPAEAWGTAEPRVGTKLVELLERELERTGVEVADPEVLDRLRAGTEAQKELPDVRANLEAGKEAYLFLDSSEAVRALSQAHAQLSTHLARTSELELLAEACIYLGAAHLASGASAEAHNAFVELLRLHPEYPIDEKVFPPPVVRAFEQARESVRRLPRAELSVSSVPPLATVTLDGQRRGDTPLTISDLVVGRHALRVDAAGRHPWWRDVELEPDGSSVEVHLEASRAGDNLRALENELRGRGSRDLLARQTAALARDAGVDAVFLTVVARTAGNLVTTMARIDTEGAVRVAWAVIDPDLLRAQEAVRGLVTALDGTGGRVETGLTSELEPEHDRYLLGLVPASLAPAPDATPQEPEPWWTSWWFWTGAAAVLVGAGVGTYLLARPDQRVERRPDQLTVGVSLTP